MKRFCLGAMLVAISVPAFAGEPLPPAPYGGYGQLGPARPFGGEHSTFGAPSGFSEPQHNPYGWDAGGPDRVDAAGNSSHTIGSITYNPDGSTSQTLGDTTLHSDGRSSHQRGNARYNTDGSAEYRVGNVTYGSDGSVCQRIDGRLFCE